MLERVADALAARGLLVTIAETRGPGEATRLARRAASEGAHIVAAAGGDGTIREVAAGMTGCGARLAIVPMGTTSVLAAELRLPRRPDAIADVIAFGTPRAIHVPRANGRPFLLMAGAGFDGAVVEAVTPSLKRRLGKAAYALQAFRVSATGPCPRIRVDADGSVRHAQWVVVANVSQYAGRFVLAPGADPRAPELAVRLFAHTHPRALAGHLLRSGLGRPLHAAGTELISAREVLLSADGRVPVQIDGDAIGVLPLKLHATEDRIEVLCP